MKQSDFKTIKVPNTFATLEVQKKIPNAFLAMFKGCFLPEIDYEKPTDLKIVLNEYTSDYSIYTLEVAPAEQCGPIYDLFIRMLSFPQDTLGYLGTDIDAPRFMEIIVREAFTKAEIELYGIKFSFTPDQTFVLQCKDSTAADRVLNQLLIIAGSNLPYEKQDEKTFLIHTTDPKIAECIERADYYLWLRPLETFAKRVRKRIEHGSDLKTSLIPDFHSRVIDGSPYLEAKYNTYNKNAFGLAISFVLGASDINPYKEIENGFLYKFDLKLMSEIAKGRHQDQTVQKGIFTASANQALTANSPIGGTKPSIPKDNTSLDIFTSVHQETYCSAAAKRDLANLTITPSYKKYGYLSTAARTVYPPNITITFQAPASAPILSNQLNNNARVV